MVGVLVAALGLAVAVTPRKRPGGPIVDRSGGYQITLPASWVRHGIDADHPGGLLRADDHAYFGRWPHQWTWVVRWGGTWRSQAAAADAVAAQIRRDGATKVERRLEPISGHLADVVSWTNDPPIGWVAAVARLGP